VIDEVDNVGDRSTAVNGSRTNINGQGGGVVERWDEWEERAAPTRDDRLLATSTRPAEYLTELSRTPDEHQIRDVLAGDDTATRPREDSYDRANGRLARTGAERRASCEGTGVVEGVKKRKGVRERMKAKGKNVWEGLVGGQHGN
jgi:hypothetical protein